MYTGYRECCVADATNQEKIGEGSPCLAYNGYLLNIACRTFFKLKFFHIYNIEAIFAMLN